LEVSVQDNGDFSAGVVAIENERVVVVRNSDRKNPLWKFPAGHKKQGESPEECAVRELFGETGIKVKTRDLVFIAMQPRRGHNFYLFGTKNCDTTDMKENGDEGEEVRLITTRDIMTWNDFMGSHREMAQGFLSEVDFEGAEK
jgi:ADP-ribose pyrophosphatase YjhB (NUDIX family)